MKKIRIRLISLSLILLVGLCSYAFMNNFGINRLNKVSDEKVDLKLSSNSITIVTPQNKTYTDAMEGYYPATFGFENDRENTDPNGWKIDRKGGAADIIGDLDGHKKVVELQDTDTSYETRAIQTFGKTQSYGSIEFWWRVTDATDPADAVIYEPPGGSYAVCISIREDKFRRYYSPGFLWYDVGKIASDNTWYHIHIDFECTEGNYSGLPEEKWQVYIDGEKYGPYPMIGTHDHQSLGSFQIYTRTTESGYSTFYDAVGYSWDPNYQVGDNLYEGLLISFDSNSTLDRKSYSLDSQNKRPILGNTTIRMPEDGLHTIHIFGMDQLGINHQSEIRYFTVDFPIDIITPEAKTYSKPMNGYYFGTYGFENDKSGDFPNAWSEEGYGSYQGRVYVVDSKDGHNNVLYLNDPGGGIHLYPAQIFYENITSGTVEYWIYYNSHNYHTHFFIKNSLDQYIVDVYSYDNVWYYKNGTTEINTGLNSINEWFRVSIDFSGDGTYKDLDANKYKFRIYQADGSLYFESPIANYSFTGDAYEVELYTGNTQAIEFWADAISYSWDIGYNVGDNFNEGLLLSYENNTNLDWMGYSLDGQINRTILGNATIPLPEDGPHSIRVYGNNSLGTNFQSNIRCFSVHHLNLITPEDKIYTCPMSGYYPATYGFENDKSGDFPNAWSEEGYGSYQGRVYVVDSKDGHNNVLYLNDPGGGIHLYPAQIFYENITSGTVEYWIYYNSHNYHTHFFIKNSLDQYIVDVYSYDNVWYYKNGTTEINTGLNSINEWFRVSIDFSGDGTYKDLDANKYKFRIYQADGSLYFESPIANYSFTGDAYEVELYTGNTQAIEFWADAISYSWDIGYNVGDNFNEGLLLSYENSTNLDWQGYSLDSQSIIPILGNTSIPFPKDGSHHIQVIGNDTLGSIYNSELRYFSVDTGSFFNISTPENKTYFAPTYGYYPATFGFENDQDASDPFGWVDTYGVCEIIDEFQGHNKVLKMEDPGPGDISINHIFETPEEHGTIEFWWAIEDASYAISSQIYQIGQGQAFSIGIDNEKFVYNNHTGGMYNLGKSTLDNTWYHMRIDFETSSGGYMGLSQWYWQVAIDNEQFGPFSFRYNNTPSGQNFYHFNGDICYADAIGYSWDSNYNIGDNANDGLLISTIQNTELTWLGYSLEGQINKTIFGNTTIPYLDEGVHQIQLFGEDSRGILYESELRYFKVDYGIEIKTPEDKVYNEPMSGYYPATFGFEEDSIGSRPSRLVSDVAKGISVQVIEEYINHKKVVEFIDTNSSPSANILDSFASAKSNGVVEFWICTNDSAENIYIRIRGSISELAVVIRTDGNMFQCYDSTSWSDLIPCINDKWYHFSVEFNCSTDTFDIYIDNTLIADDYGFRDGDLVDVHNFQIYSSASNNLTYYVDAIGYSWDPGYNVGDNLNEGLLLSFTNSTVFDWQGFSLDLQPIKTILGNSTIKMPVDGEHLIRVFGNDSLGELYQSRLQHFEVSSIKLVTPVNQTYTQPMDGYYLATHGFENDEDGTYPEGWTILEASDTSVQVISGIDGHQKVLELYDNNNAGAGLVKLWNNFSSVQVYGTVEFWWRISDASQAGAFRLANLDVVTDSLFAVEIRNNEFRYTNGTDYSLCPASSNNWYHLSVDFECSTGNYKGLNQYSCFIHINGSKYGPFKFENNEPQATLFWISTASTEMNYYMYFDAIGYSWDSNYQIGANMDEGLLLSYKNRIVLDWQGYSLDDHISKTIYGNTTIPIPENGVHSVQVFGNDSLGLEYYSQIRYFTVQYFPIDIITPENKTYTDPMSGYYPATYGFEDTHNNNDPLNFLDSEDNWKVIDEFNGHKKVYNCYEGGAIFFQQFTTGPQSNGTFECWAANEITTYTSSHSFQIRLHNGTVDICCVAIGVGDKFLYLDNTGWHDTGLPVINNKWYHIRMDFEATNGGYMGLSQYQWNLYINGTKIGPLSFINNIAPTYMLSWSMPYSHNRYVDAIGYSWDPNYKIGDNLNEGLLLSYESEIALDWQGYSLDSQTIKTILGNTTIPLPSDGLHTIQVFGNDTVGYMRSSLIRYFTISCIADIINPNITINSPLLYDLFGSSEPYFNITVIEPNLDTMWYTLDGGLTIVLITEPTGNIDQIEWGKFGNGTVTIRFYANDTAGNVGWEDVLVRKDVLPPEITITTPISNYLFGSTTPSFSLIIVEPNLNIMWYTLDGGVTILLITEPMGNIDQTEWDNFGNGTVTIRFYANDSVGNSDWEEVTVRKDVLSPEITINSPEDNQAFTDRAPSFELTINEGNLDEIWYTLDGGEINETCTLTGDIIQEYWNALPPGEYTLRFYATDTLGHEGYAEVSIKKSESPAIPTYNINMLYLIMIFSLISISWQLKKKIK
ncbi:MAG: hypothetical protein ACFFCV_00915 [Promethearchaeota archaeon]